MVGYQQPFVNLLGKTLIVSFGGGVNSTAMLCGLSERGIRPDAIVFSDTGGERPETYAHIGQMQCWLRDRGWPSIITVQYKPSRVPDKTLEEEVLRRRALPALAYGWHTCSIKWKRQPFLKWAKTSGVLPAVVMYGIDAGETWRQGKQASEPGFTNWYPLLTWDWAREECVAAIQRHGLPVPPKSSCFYCPAMKKDEVRALQREHPELLERALKIEDQALAESPHTTTKGLNRGWSWRKLLEMDSAAAAALRDPDPVPCGCADGEVE